LLSLLFDKKKKGRNHSKHGPRSERFGGAL